MIDQSNMIVDKNKKLRLITYCIFSYHTNDIQYDWKQKKLSLIIFYKFSNDSKWVFNYLLFNDLIWL